MKLTDREFAELMKGKRSMLLNVCNRLFKQRRGPSQIRTVKGMVGWLVGKPLGQKAAWLWLLEEGVKQIAPKKGKTAYRHVGSKAFYESSAWRAVRFEALKSANGCCNLCGRSNREHGVVLHVDHIKPKSLFPHLSLDISNLQILCADCNIGKSNRDDTDWRAERASSTSGA